jgi:hypothetical protein
MQEQLPSAYLLQSVTSLNFPKGRHNVPYSGDGLLTALDQFQQGFRTDPVLVIQHDQPLEDAAA